MIEQLVSPIQLLPHQQLQHTPFHDKIETTTTVSSNGGGIIRPTTQSINSSVIGLTTPLPVTDYFFSSGGISPSNKIPRRVTAEFTPPPLPKSSSPSGTTAVAVSSLPSPLIGGTSKSVFVPFQNTPRNLNKIKSNLNNQIATHPYIEVRNKRDNRPYEITHNKGEVWKHLHRLFSFCRDCVDESDETTTTENYNRRRSFIGAKDNHGRQRSSSYDSLERSLDLVKKTTEGRDDRDVKMVHVIHPSHEDVACYSDISHSDLSKFTSMERRRAPQGGWESYDNEQSSSTTPSELSFSLSSSTSSTSVPERTATKNNTPQLPPLGRPPRIKNRVISNNSNVTSRPGLLQQPPQSSSFSLSSHSKSSQHRRTDSAFEFSPTRLNKICKPIGGTTPVNSKIKEVHCRENSNVSPLMDEASHSDVIAVPRGQKECTPIQRYGFSLPKRKFIFDTRPSLEGLNVNLFNEQSPGDQEERDSALIVPMNDDSGVSEAMRKEFRDDYPISTNPKARKFHSHNDTSFLSPDATTHRNESSYHPIIENAGFYLPTCPLFLKYLRTKGIKGKCIFEGWVAFFLGGQKLDQLKTSKKLRRSDLRYVLIVGENKPVLYAFLSPDLATAGGGTGDNNDKTPSSTTAGDRANNDTVIINLSRGISIESWFMTKRKGHCIVVRDAKARRNGQVLCSLLATNLPPCLFVDSICSRLVDSERYDELQETLLSPIVSLSGAERRNDRQLRKKRRKSAGKGGGMGGGVHSKFPEWGDPEYLLKFAPVAQYEAATHILFSVSAIVKNGKVGKDHHHHHGKKR